jgi:hypothetical protein
MMNLNSLGLTTALANTLGAQQNKLALALPLRRLKVGVVVPPPLGAATLALAVEHLVMVLLSVFVEPLLNLTIPKRQRLKLLWCERRLANGWANLAAAFVALMPNGDCAIRRQLFANGGLRVLADNLGNHLSVNAVVVWFYTRNTHGATRPNGSILPPAVHRPMHGRVFQLRRQS